MILWYILLIVLIGSPFALVKSYELIKNEQPRETVVIPQTMSRAEQRRIVNELLRTENRRAWQRAYTRRNY